MLYVGVDSIRVCQFIVIWFDHLLLHNIDAHDLAFILLHEDVSILLDVDFVRIELKNEVHHDFSIEVSWVDKVVDVQSLAVVEGLRHVIEGKTVNEDLSVETFLLT